MQNVLQLSNIHVVQWKTTSAKNWK